MKRYRRPLVPLIVVAALTAVAGDVTLKPPEKPAEIVVTVAPDGVRPGDDVHVRVQLEPIEGIKINRYPKIRLTVPEQAGLAAASETAIGNEAPPPPGGDPEANYYEQVDPLELSLTLDPAIGRGPHELEGRLVYAYCVSASGFCTRKKVSLRIPVTVDPS